MLLRQAPQEDQGTAGQSPGSGGRDQGDEAGEGARGSSLRAPRGGLRVQGGGVGAGEEEAQGGGEQAGEAAQGGGGPDPMLGGRDGRQPRRQGVVPPRHRLPRRAHEGGAGAARGGGGEVEAALPRHQNRA